jgi:hypothetical protein
VKLQSGTRWVIGLVLASALAAFAAARHAGAGKDDKKDNTKAAARQVVDSGSFGVFVKKQRVLTETFSISQQNDISIIKAQLKETAGADPTSQKSDMEITSKGELIRYEWSQSTGGSLTVLPENDFLKERITASATAKAAEQAFLLPSVTPILDNNFFVHREVLAWKYLNAVCQPSGSDTKCRQEAAEFGTLVPQDRISMSVRLELMGREKITIRGAERELLHLKLTGESLEWGLWVDDLDHYKLIRVAIPADDTEVVRD